MTSVLERTWKEADVTYFGAWSHNWPEMAEVDYEPEGCPSFKLRFD